jgi:glyoxylase-like metal-dependent hydrolase (beta-lactamase superfamily II)
MRAILVCAVTLASCASTPAREPWPTTVDNPFLQIMERVTDRVYVLRQAQPNFAGVVGNVTIIEQDDSLVLVDSGNSRGTGQRVVEAVRRLSDKPVSAVIVTHWHNDHPLGLPAIVEAWPDVEIIATEATSVQLRAGATNVPTQPDAAYEARRTQLLTSDYVTLIQGYVDDESLSQAERDGWSRALSALDIRARDEIGTHLVLPTRTFTDTLHLDDRHAPIDVRFLGPANTDGDLVVLLPRQRVVVAGDIVVAPIPYMFNVYVEENLSTLEQLRALPFDTLIPGHGETQRGTAYLDRLTAFVRDIHRQVAPLAAEGLSAEEIVARINTEPHAQAFAGDDPWLRLWFRDYAATPLIESAVREARGESPAN